MLLRSRSRRVCPQADPLAQATDACNQGTDPPFFAVRYINSYVGSGVFCNQQFHKGDFLLEYRGELISLHEGIKREKSYPRSKGNFLYFFDYGNTRKCIDATNADGFARMVNDGVKRANCKVKAIFVEEKLRLCLFATKDLRKGEELFFDYGVKDLPWRKEGWEGDSDVEEKVSNRPRRTSRRTEGNTPKESTENEVNDDNSEDEYIPDSCEEEIDDDYEDTWEPSGQSPKKGMQKKKKDVLQWQVNAKGEGSRTCSTRYRKPGRRCPFCLNIYKDKLSLHIRTIHKDIEMVAAALKLPRKARDAAFSLMRKEGIRISNREEMKSATPSFQRERKTVANCSLVMCNLCRGFYSKTLLYRHKRNCQGKNCLSIWSMPTSFPTCEPKTKKRRPEIKRVVPSSYQDVTIDDYDDTWEPGQSPKKGMQKKKKFTLQWQVNAKDEGSRAGSTRYRKPVRRCPFCLNIYQEKLSLHIRTIHKDIEMVAAALKLPRKARDAAFSLMKKEGIRISNKEEMKSATPSFQRERNTVANCSLVMCTLCRGFYSKTFLTRHKRNCQGKNCLDMWSMPTSFPTCEPKTKRPRPEIKRVVPSNYRDVNVEEMLQLDETLAQVNGAKYEKLMRKCPFCLKFYSKKLSLHIRTIHKDNERVSVALRLPKKERDAAFRLMKKEGILINNKEEMKSVTPRFQRERKTKSKDTLVMCGLCKGFYSKKRIGRHRDVCQGSRCLESSSVPASSCESEPSDARSSEDVPCNRGGNDMKEIHQVPEKESEIFDEEFDGKYRKPTRKCPFCLKLYRAKLSGHIERVHKDIERVSEALKLPKKARREAFDLMKKEGILIANKTQMLSATPKYQRERKTNSNASSVMCEGCKGFYSKNFLPRHKVYCRQPTFLSLSEPPVKKSRRPNRKKSGIEIPAKRNRPRVKKVGNKKGKLQLKNSQKVKCQGGVSLRSKSIPVSLLASEPLSERDTLEFQKEILHKFQNDELGQICRSDPMIETVGMRLWKIEHGNQKKKPEETCRKVMWDMRRLASLYKNFVEQSRLHDRCQSNELGGNVRDMFDCHNFNTLSASIFSYTSHERNPSVKSAVRFNLYFLFKKWCNMIKAADVSEGKEDDGIDRFLLVLEMNRGRLFGDAVMQVTGNHQKQTTQSDSAFEDDIQKLRMHTLAEMSWMLKGEFGVWDHWTFARLRDLTVSRLTLLNSWRGSEPCCMLLENWQQVDSSSGRDEQLLISFEDPLGKQLPSSFKVRYQTCKGNNHQHPILCPAECISAMEILTNKETRSAAGIEVNNQYVFAFGEGSTDHVSVWYALDRLCKDAGVEANLTDVRCRRHISVLYTTLEAPEGKRRPFFESEAHSEENSASINGEPATAMEVESVGKELSQIGEGKKRQHPESLPEEEGPVTETTRYEPVPRRYTKWNSRDEALVRKHFHDIITGCGSKRIPGERDINFFLEHYKLSVPLTWMTVKSKVVNERKKWLSEMKVQQNKV